MSEVRAKRLGYEEYVRKRHVFGTILIFTLAIAFFTALCLGSYALSPEDIVKTLFGNGDRYSNLVVWNIRLPRIAASVIAGMSLALAGAVMQCVLRNPLASPFTIGISHGAAFGAAFAIIVLGAGELHRTGEGVAVNNPYLIPVFAFLGAIAGVIVILMLAKVRDLSPEAMVLAGIAMASLFSAGTMLMQYFAEDVKVAAVVFWTFGDLGRARWVEVELMFLSCVFSLLYFLLRSWDYNALLSGDEVAISIGVDPGRIRLESLLVAAFLTAVCVSFLGIIGFVGLVAPHAVRLVVGGDYRYLIPLSALLGSLILLVADTVGRTVIAPIVLPVGIVTSFIGAPLFIYLLSKVRA